MKRLAVLCCVVLSQCAPKSDPSPPPKEASTNYRRTLATTETLSVSEGLPHQMWERSLLEREIKRTDTAKIWKYPFYTPSVLATNPDDLKRLLSSPDSIKVYEGPKLCGGYHPDYCVSWQAEKKTYHALICFGCDEVVFFDGTSSLIYDLSDDACNGLKELLSSYAKKRPHQAKG